MPKDWPLRSTLFEYFNLWDCDGTLDLTHQNFYFKCCEAMGRAASRLTAIDYQSVKSEKKRGLHWTVRLRWGKENKRQEAPHFCRYLRFVAPHHQEFRKYIRSRSIYSGSYTLIQSNSISENTLRRRQISRALFLSRDKKILSGMETEIVEGCDAAVGFEIIPRRWDVEKHSPSSEDTVVL